MNYLIRSLDSFSVIGQKVELTNSKQRNIQICTAFWREFNRNLKKAHHSQFGNWIKYAFMERRSEKLFYYCAVPKKANAPEGFTQKDIKPTKYLVVEHIGPMGKIYDTYEKVYKEKLPGLDYEPICESYLHFERYDYRFGWCKENSIIEIWVPISDYY